MRKSVFIKVILIIFIVCISIFLLIPRIKIKPNKNHINIAYYGEQYEDAGAQVYSCNILSCKFISKDINIINNVNTGKLGTYIVRYEYHYKGTIYSAIRNVKVIDIQSPVITLNDDSKIYLTINSKYDEKGALSTDNYDGDITDKIIVKGKVDTSKVGTYIIQYKSVDSSNNESIISRKIYVYDDNKNTSLKNIKSDKIDNAIDDIEKYITDKRLSVSIIYYDILSGYEYTYNPNKVYYGCSLIKTLDAMYVYENMNITNTLRTLVKKAIEVSDNDAHYSLVNKIGRNILKKYGEELGAKNVLTTKDIYGNTTVYDQLVYMKHLFKLINTIDDKKELKGFFFSDFKKYIKFDGAPDIMHKYGRIHGVYFHESAIILDDSPYIVSILTQEDDRKSIITELSKKIYNLHSILNEK